MFSLRKKLWYGSVLILTALLLLAGCDNPAGGGRTSYTVKFDSRGGSDVPSQSVASGGRALSPGPVVKDGNVLDGWYESLEGGEAWNFAADTVTANLTLHAKWSELAPNAWVVNFDARGGNPAPADQAVAGGGRITAPSPVPSRNGYTLDGWYTEAEYTTRWNFSAVVTASVTLYAKWTAVEAGKVVATFDGRGGSPVPEPRVVDKGAALSRPSNPAKTGHDFAAWYASLADDAEAWDFAAAVTENITLYAKWTARQYEVSFVTQGGAVPGQTVAYGGKVSEPPAPVNGSLVLDGWYKETGLLNRWDFSLDTVEGRTTLYAKWVDAPPGSFLVSFNLRGGSGAVESQIIAENGKVAEPDTPVRDNYVFDGWYTETGYLTKWDFDADTVTARTTLYAAWKAVWTVTFNTQPNGSAVTPLEGVVNGSYIVKPSADPARTGYRFAGWYKTAAGTNNAWDFDTDTVTANTILYARWTPLYAVAFTTGEGSDVATIEDVLSGAVIAKPAADPTLAGCSFDAWYKETGYVNQWNFETDTVTADTTLYARWTVTALFDPNAEGVTAPESRTLTRGALLTRPGDPENPGQTLMDWYKEAACENRWNFAADTVTADITLYAKWLFVPVTNIRNLPAEGFVDKVLDLRGVVEPSNASVKTIVWTVLDGGSTELSAGDTAPLTPGYIGTLKLKAVVPGGAAGGADYVQGDYTRGQDEIAVSVTRIRKVTGITGIALSGTYERNTTIDLNDAKVAPANATEKKIEWSIDYPDAGVSAIADNQFTLTQGGTLRLIATVKNGDEDYLGVKDYTEPYAFFVKASVPGGVDLGEDASIKLYVSGKSDPLPADAVWTVEGGTECYIHIDSGYDNNSMVWRLNGNLSTVKGPMLKLNTEIPGTLVVRVEAKKSGQVEDGVYTFNITE